MKWVKRIGLAVLIVVVLFVVVGLVLPNDYAVERSITINASPEQVHALVGDLTRWEEWGPWEENDPTIVTTFGEKTTGVGASQSWTDKSGGGRLTLTESSVETGIAYDMDFMSSQDEDAEAIPAQCAMRYAPVDGGTQVTWTMEGAMPVPVLGGYLAMTLPGMIGSMFDSGLEKLKEKAEAEPMPVDEPDPEEEEVATATDEAVGG